MEIYRNYKAINIIDNSGTMMYTVIRLAYIIPFLTVQKVKKAEKRDTYAKKRIVSFLPRFPKLS